jgi:glycosyltransferase involved in cell wall biosynthesis
MELRETRARLELPEAFAYYPAQTWKHKNHLALLDALSLLRDRDGIEVPVVFTGHQNSFHVKIDRKVRSLGLQSQVRFLGYVAPADVQALYMLSRMLVFPSLFEGFGLPVAEAFRRGVAVACSTATCLPEIAGGAAELFDPRSVGEMAAAIRRVWTDPDLRRRLVERGRARGSTFTWRDTAARHRALYRQVAGRRLEDSDQILLRRMAEAR